MQEEKKYPPNADPLDAGAPLPLPQPNYVNEGGEAVYLMADEQRRQEKAELPTAGAAPPALASKELVPTTGGTEVKKYIRQEVVTGEKAALRGNLVVVGVLSWAFLLTLPFSKEWAGNILNSVSGPEPRSEVAQGSEMYTNLALGLGEALLFGGASAARAKFQTRMPSIRSATMGGNRTSSFLESGIEVGYGQTSTRIGTDEATLAVEKSVKPWPSTHDVILHAEGGRFSPGTPKGRFETHEAQIADAIMGNPNLKPGQPLRLLSCALCSEQAQQVANLTGRPVFASPLVVGVTNRTGNANQAANQFIRFDYMKNDYTGTAGKQVWNLYEPKTNF
jgi:hypothetical protein